MTNQMSTDLIYSCALLICCIQSHFLGYLPAYFITRCNPPGASGLCKIECSTLQCMMLPAQGALHCSFGLLSCYAGAAHAGYNALKARHIRKCRWLRDASHLSSGLLDFAHRSSARCSVWRCRRCSPWSPWHFARAKATWHLVASALGNFAARLCCTMHARLSCMRYKPSTCFSAVVGAP